MLFDIIFNVKLFFRKEVYDLLNAKKREIDKDSRLYTFENDASHLMKYLVSYFDQISKLGVEIGKNEDQAKKLLYEHNDSISAIDVSQNFDCFFEIYRF